LGTAPEWDAEITLDEPDQAIGWRSIEGSATKTAGRVNFKSFGTRTEVEVTLEYEPPAGPLGDAVAKIFANPEHQIDEDLHRFKELMEQSSLVSDPGPFGGAEGDKPLGTSLGATTAND